MIYFLGIGSNLGEREQHISSALRMMDEHIGHRLGVAPLMYSAPQGFDSEHTFCNTVVLYDSPLEPAQVLALTQAIERQEGRTESSVRMPDGSKLYADREIDIDLLRVFADNGLEVTADMPELMLPHPLMQQRAFVMQPMRQLIRRIADGLPFIKMDGLGNDYIYFDCTSDKRPLALLPEVTTYAPLWSDRQQGIGADGLVFIMRDKDADLRMRIFNADGSEAEMCGNASRCVGLYAVQQGLFSSHELTLATLGGLRRITVVDSEHISVEMGQVHYLGANTLDGRIYHSVDVGNPHAVTILDDSDALTAELVHSVGAMVETNALYPNRTNVEFCVVIDRHHVAMRVWERGSGETQACGTGATATAFACIHQGLCDSPVTVSLLGGSLTITLTGEEATMTGAGTIAYTGTTTVK